MDYITGRLASSLWLSTRCIRIRAVFILHMDGPVRCVPDDEFIGPFLFNLRPAFSEYPAVRESVRMLAVFIRAKRPLRTPEFVLYRALDALELSLTRRPYSTRMDNTPQTGHGIFGKRIIVHSAGQTAFKGDTEQTGIRPVHKWLETWETGNDRVEHCMALRCNMVRDAIEHDVP